MYKINDEKMFYDMADGQAIIINFTTGVYYGSASLGSEIIDRLIKGYDPALVLSAVKAAPGCPADIEDTFSAFIKALLDKEIIAAGDTVPGGDEPIGAEALIDGFAFTVDEFADVQDLLMADPVHDVDIDMGWPIMKEE